MRNPRHFTRIDNQHGSAGLWRVRTGRAMGPSGIAALLTFVLACLLPALAQAAIRQSSLDIRIQILPSAEVATLPEPVQRLDSLMPGYGDHWTHARNLAATDPLHAVRTLRAVHQRARDQHGADAWLDDMVAAGQGLLADLEMTANDAGATAPFSAGRRADADDA